jgi:hypothetical protein
MPMPARNLRPSSTSLAAPRQYFVGGSLTKIAIADVPLMHPVHRVFDLYSALHKQDVGQHMPRLETVVSQLSPELMSYAMVLLPVSVNDSLDFAILHQGLNIPGVLKASAPSQYYSENVMPAMFIERVLEITTCLSLRCESITQGTAARPSALDMKVFRSILPVWKSGTNQHAVMLVTAPVFAC